MSFRRSTVPGTGPAVTFTFDGRQYPGYEGESLCQALLANGILVQGRSFKYHRPRGPFAPGSAEPNALVTLVRGAYREPNIRATEVEVFDGLVAQSQNRFPSLTFDVNAVNGLAGKLFSAGFYYKTFMGPAIGPLKSTKFWMVAEHFIRRAAGLGRAGLAPDPDRYERMNSFCDILVVGAGEAGRAAAATVANAGLKVILADANRPAAAAIDGVQSLARTTIWGAYDGNTWVGVERVADHKPDRKPGEPRQRHWVIRAKTAIIATGATERQIVFPGNDVPGVMLASLAGQLAKAGVVPQVPVTLFTNNDAAYQTAADLAAAGAKVAAIIDVRQTISAPARALADLCDADLHLGRGVVKTDGRKSLTCIHVRNLDQDGKQDGATIAIPCSVLAVSGGWSPSIQLTSQAGGKPAWSEDLQAFFRLSQDRAFLSMQPVQPTAFSAWMKPGPTVSAQPKRQLPDCPARRPKRKPHLFAILQGLQRRFMKSGRTEKRRKPSSISSTT